MCPGNRNNKCKDLKEETQNEKELKDGKELQSVR